MIVEFIGCTGAGKTTLISQVRARLAETTRVVTAHELVARRVGMGVAPNPTVRNLVEELAGLPYFVGALPRYRDFIAVAVRLFTRDLRPSLAAINNLRSLERKIGGYEIVLRHNHATIVLVDEGPIQAAHMFAFSPTLPGPREIARFADLLPLPDLVVYVRSSLDTLVKRTNGRADPPREMRSKDGASTESSVRNAVSVFDRLAEVERLRSRMLVANNPDDPQTCGALAQEVAAAILAHKSAPGAVELVRHLAPELS